MDVDKVAVDSTEDWPASLGQAQVSPRPVLEDMTIFIPTLGRPLLEKCLLAIVMGTTWPAHLIVVDQGQNKLVVDWILQLNRIGISATHVRSSQKGAGAARNRCLERVHTTFAVATDDDCIVAPDWLEKMAHHLRRHTNSILTGRVEAGKAGFVPSTITLDRAVVYKRPLLVVDVLYTGNFGLAKATADRIGPFDEDPQFLAAEDNEWQYRALRAGIPIRYVPDVIVTHMDWREFDQQMDLYRRYAHGQGFFYGKHIRLGDGFLLLRAVYSLGRGSLRWLRGLLRRDMQLKASGRASVLDLSRGILIGFQRSRPVRHKPQGHRT